MKYLSHDKEFLRVLCAQALMIAAHENEACKTAVTKAGAVQPLCVLLKDGSDAKAKAMAARKISTTTATSHRIASQPLLSGVDKGKVRTNLGKNSVLPQIQIYCVT